MEAVTKAYLNLGVILAAIALFQLFFAPIQVFSQENSELAEIQDLIHQVDSLAEARQLDTAIILGKLALEKAEKKFGDSDTTVADVLNVLGVCYYYQANYAKCDSLYNKALAIREKALGPDHPDVAVSLNNLARLYGKQDKYKEAEPLHKRALAIREKGLGPDHPDVAKCLNNLAVLYWRQGKYTEAEPLYKRALDIWEKALGPGHPHIAGSLSNLAIVYWKQGKYVEAEPMLIRALNIWEKTLGPEHPDVALGMGNLANLYQEQGKYTEAEHLYKRALAIRKKALGHDHPWVAASLNNLAAFYTIQGKYHDAESLHKHVLAMREKALGAEHPRVASSLENLANVYYEQAKYAEAEPLYKRALAIREKALGSDHPKVAQSLGNLALLYGKQGKYTEAEPLHIRALAIREKALGRDHPTVARGLSGLATLYRAQSKFTEAEFLQTRALAIREKAFGPDHSLVATSLESLANLNAGQSKYAEAESLFQQAIAIRENALGPDHPVMATTLGNLATLYWEQGKYAEAEPLCRRALSIKEKTLSSEHPDVATSLKLLTILYGSSGEADKGIIYYKKLQQSRQHFIEYAFSYASEDQKMRYIEKYPLINQSLLSFAIGNESDESKSSALEMMLKGKAVVIDALSAERQIAYCSYDDQILKKAERHAEVCGEISTVTLVGAEKLDPEIYRDRLQTLYSIKDSLETGLSKDCAEFKDELVARRFAVVDVANALPQGSVLWEFVRYEPYDFKKIGSDEERTGPSRYLAFTLDGSGNITLTDLGNAGEIDSLVRLARERIYKDRAKVRSPMAGELEKKLSEVTGRLYEIVFAPLESSLGSRTSIFVSPEGQLSLLPFEILPCPDGKYVIEKFSISYLSSGRDLLKFGKKAKPTDWALVMADPDFELSTQESTGRKNGTSIESSIAFVAPEPARGVSSCLDVPFKPLHHSKEEAESISRTLREKAELDVRAYYGGDALEEVLKSMASPPGILHLATHGYFCEDVDLATSKFLENPLLRCGLALAGANRLMDESQKGDSQTEDGVLTAFEASGLNLIGTELVTLSACETGVGEVKSGEGVYGLRRAFQHAGARAVLMSLWKVPDKETCDLMVKFYDNWLSGGHTKKEALRRATLEVMKDCREKYGVAHPYFWGGFALLGDPN